MKYKEVGNMRGSSITVEECEDLVKGPGKFEGCARYIPYFHDISMDGGADDEEWDDNDNVTYIFEVNEDDVDMFDELTDIEYIKFYENDDGFIVEV